MKISVWIPKGKKNVKTQLQSELKPASQIKDAYKRANVTKAIEKIIDRITDTTSGIFICSDGQEVICQPYKGKTSLFRADKEYIIPNKLS